MRQQRCFLTYKQHTYVLSIAVTAGGHGIGVAFTGFACMQPLWLNVAHCDTAVL